MDKTLERLCKSQLRTLGINVSQLREKHGISQKELSVMLGYTNHTHLSRVESGQKAPSVSVLLEVADILEVPIADLFDGA